MNKTPELTLEHRQYLKPIAQYLIDLGKFSLEGWKDDRDHEDFPQGLCALIFDPIMSSSMGCGVWIYLSYKLGLQDALTDKVKSYEFHKLIEANNLKEYALQVFLADFVLVFNVEDECGVHSIKEESDDPERDWDNEFYLCIEGDTIPFRERVLEAFLDPKREGELTELLVNLLFVFLDPSRFGKQLDRFIYAPYANKEPISGFDGYHHYEKIHPKVAGLKELLLAYANCEAYEKML